MTTDSTLAFVIEGLDQGHVDLRVERSDYHDMLLLLVTSDYGQHEGILTLHASLTRSDALALVDALKMLAGSLEGEQAEEA